MTDEGFEEACQRFVHWLEEQVNDAGTGDQRQERALQPEWLDLGTRHRL